MRNLICTSRASHSGRCRRGRRRSCRQLRSRQHKQLEMADAAHGAPYRARPQSYPIRVQLEWLHEKPCRPEEWSAPPLGLIGIPLHFRLGNCRVRRLAAQYPISSRKEHDADNGKMRDISFQKPGYPLGSEFSRSGSLFRRERAPVKLHRKPTPIAYAREPVPQPTGLRGLKTQSSTYPARLESALPFQSDKSGRAAAAAASIWHAFIRQCLCRRRRPK